MNRFKARLRPYFRP